MNVVFLIIHILPITMCFLTLAALKHAWAMSSEPIWIAMLKSIWQSVIKPPSGEALVCTSVCGNIYTLNRRHMECMCSAKFCKLIRQPDQREKRKKWEWNTYTQSDWSTAKFSHRNHTLTDWLWPQSRWFCTWNCARCYFWAMTCWRNPRGRDRRRTLIQTPATHTHTHTLPECLWRVFIRPRSALLTGNKSVFVHVYVGMNLKRDSCIRDSWGKCLLPRSIQ